MDAAIFGVIVADLIAEGLDLRHPPPPGGLVRLASLSLTTGGNACNCAVAMAKLGMNVATAGLVGRDVLGAAVVEKLRSSGVNTTNIVEHPTAQTSATVVAVEPGGERVFFHTPGVTSHVDADTFRKCFPLFRQCQWLQVGYFGLLPALTPALPELLSELRLEAPHLKIALDTVNPPGSWTELQPILAHLDLFAPSRTEAAALTGETEPARMASVFRRLMPPESIVAIKLDAAGCYLHSAAGSFTVPSYKIDVVDTTGAGDTWFGGLLTGLIKDMPLEQAARFANRAAADCCTALGASTGVRTFEQTLERSLKGEV